MLSPDKTIQGPSPRVRGSLRAGWYAGRLLGSIPACAGKPYRPRLTTSYPRVHPRVCGEARYHRNRRVPETGPSPRVRGSLLRLGEVHPGVGSIPACAGKPELAEAIRGTGWVHPRVCGEAQSSASIGQPPPGPSPRVRGSPGLSTTASAGRGSIPACAGKPGAQSAVPRVGTVHPRVCGEAASWPQSTSSWMGPSPRVRGSPRPCHVGHVEQGSIPACAGKPLEAGRAGHAERVHPRVCGEALLPLLVYVVWWGPSPRVRGSRVTAPSSILGVGSIPACAGKPRRLGAVAGTATVHPRVCGEAASPLSMCSGATGPSPRVRGSLCQIIDEISGLFSCQ